MFGLNEGKSIYQKLNLIKNLLRVGAGAYRDFYYTRTDTLDMYLAEKEVILSITKRIISLKECI